MIFLIYFITALILLGVSIKLKEIPQSLTFANKNIFFYLGLSAGLGIACQLGLNSLLGSYMMQFWPVCCLIVFAAFASYICWLVCFCRNNSRSFWLRFTAFALKTLIPFGILLFYYYNLANSLIGVTPVAEWIAPVSIAMASVLVLISFVLLMYGGGFFSKHSNAARSVYFILLGITPVLLYIIVEISWNPNVAQINLVNTLLNILVYLLLEIFLVNLIRIKSIGFIFLYLFSWFWGAVNYFLLQFRGQPFQVADLFSIKTAAAVADQYTYQIGEGIAWTFLLMMVVICLIESLVASGVLEPAKSKPHLIIREIVAVLTVALLTAWVKNVDFGESYLISVDYWNQATTYESTGFVPAFISFFQKSWITEPEDYSAKTAADIIEDAASSYDERDNASVSTSDDQTKPTIIAIMNESYSDLSALGPLSCTEVYNSYLRSLMDDPGTIEYGWNYVSTRGGGTSRTEFEFLTGDSMAYLGGLIPYATFNFKGVPSLVSELKEQGYHTIAMHPEAASNWQRNTVYPALGFDEMLFRDTFEGKETTVWGRISDLGDYQQVIDVYEQQTEPAFIFNITMQNHGGYDMLDQLSEDEILPVDDRFKDYSDLVVYESLIEKSDQALEYLISYFKEVDEPVIIVFFGDHQPSLDTSFEDSLLEEGQSEDDTDISMGQKRYAVPYFIWSNMADVESISHTDSEGYNITSPNYLSSLLLTYAGLELSDFDKYRLELRQQLPAINFSGYLNTDGSWHGLDEDNDYSILIDQYEIVNYNSLFDKSRESSCYSVE